MNMNKRLCIACNNTTTSYMHYPMLLVLNSLQLAKARPTISYILLVLSTPQLPELSMLLDSLDLRSDEDAMFTAARVAAG